MIAALTGMGLSAAAGLNAYIPFLIVALIAAIAGWFYGRAYLRTGSIRAAMVAHALTNVTWKAFFA